MGSVGGKQSDQRSNPLTRCLHLVDIHVAAGGKTSGAEAGEATIEAPAGLTEVVVTGITERQHRVAEPAEVGACLVAGRRAAPARQWLPQQPRPGLWHCPSRWRTEQSASAGQENRPCPRRARGDYIAHCAHTTSGPPYLPGGGGAAEERVSVEPSMPPGRSRPVRCRRRDPCRPADDWHRPLRWRRRHQPP